MILTTIAVVAQATPAATVSPTASAVPSPTASPDLAKVLDTAKAWFASLEAGKVLDNKQLTDQMVTDLTPDVLSQAKQMFGAYGDPMTMKLQQTGDKMSNTYYVFDVMTTSGKRATMLLLYDDATGKISSLRLVPAGQ